MAKLIVGCGYLGSRVAQRWLAAGEKVFAVTRSTARADEWSRTGLQPIIADVTDPATLQKLPRGIDTVLYAVGFDRAAGKPMHDVYVTGLANILQALKPGAANTSPPTHQSTGPLFIYVSTTGVYGDARGDWVNEQTPCHPTREGGRVSLAAERLLQTDETFGPRAIVLRMAGLYGPGRLPRRDDLLAGKPLAVPVDGYLNLIHVDDAAEIVVQAAARTTPPQTYVVADGTPVQRREYFAELARLLHAPPPTFIDSPPLSTGEPARGEGSKRIDSGKLHADLCPTLAYPSYREGLWAIVAAS